ncbi:MAG: tRNA adenosine(34) deaminase TadA [Planctomycetota bacterium]|jgi:tRNA(adenine34) deaminase
MDQDEVHMRQALDEARAAIPKGEVPVGCVVVHEGEVIASAHNLRESLSDPTAHAEMLAVREAAESLGQWRLDGMTVYCTVEPCCMCAGALVNARVARLVYGVADPKSGACGTIFDVPREPRLNHRLEVRGGVLADEALELLQQFFAQHR